jgi:hypothetical protein
MTSGLLVMADHDGDLQCGRQQGNTSQLVAALTVKSRRDGRGSSTAIASGELEQS